MRAFLHWLHLLTHRHEWEIYKEDSLRIRDYYDSDKITATGTRYTLRCKVCGEMTHRDIV